MSAPDSGPHIVRIERLEDELEIARDRIKQLEAALGIGDDLLPLRMLGLTKSEARVVNLLYRREVSTKEQMLMAIYADDPDRRYDVQDKIVDVFVNKSKRKLAMVGVTFGACRQGSYRMLGSDKARLARLIASNASHYGIGARARGASDRRLRRPDGRFEGPGG